MPAPAVNALPTAPQRTDTSSVFSARADAWVAALASFTAEVNALASYLDALANGAFKTYVRVATTADHGLSGLAAIDGVTPVAGDRVLVKSNTAAAQNGIYTAASGAWSRTTDADIGGELVSALIVISEGSTLADTLWVCSTNAPITLGSTALVFSQFTGGGMLGSNNLSELTNLASARSNLGLANTALALPLTFNFTAAGEARFYADVAMTLTQQATSGSGSVAYEKSTAAAPSTFSSTTSPITLEAGAWLKVTASSVVSIFTVHLKRTA